MCCAVKQNEGRMRGAERLVAALAYIHGAHGAQVYPILLIIVSGLQPLSEASYTKEDL